MIAVGNGRHTASYSDLPVRMRFGLWLGYFSFRHAKRTAVYISGGCLIAVLSTDAISAGVHQWTSREAEGREGGRERRGRGYGGLRGSCCRGKEDKGRKEKAAITLGDD